MIVVVDASTFVSAALKVDSVPEQAVFRAAVAPNCLIMSREVEDEYREVIFRRKFGRFASVQRRQTLLNFVICWRCTHGAAFRSSRPRISCA